MTEPLEPRRLLTAIASGQLVHGSLSNSSAVDSYTIDIAAGAPFLVALHRDESDSSDLTPRLRVLAPNGTTLVNQGGGSAGGVGVIVTTASTGSYEIRVASDGDTGAYTLAAFRPTANTGEADLIAADSGRRFAGTASPGDVDFYALDTTAAETVSVTVAQNQPDLALDPRVALVSSDGRVVGGVADEAGVRLEDRARNTGSARYWAVVTDGGDDDTGVFGITMTRVPGTQYAGDPDTAPLASGVTRTGDLPAGDADVFQVASFATGDNGNVITATLTRAGGSNLDPDLVLYDNNGEPIVRGARSNGGATTSFSVVVNNVAGPFWIVARDYEADDGGTFAFSYTVSQRTPPITLANGVLRIDGTAGSDTINVYRVTRDGVWKIGVDYSGYGTTSFYDADAVDSVLVDAGAGNDAISLYPSLMVGGYVLGGDGDDTLRGGNGEDSLVGGGGRNRMYGGEGGDVLRGSGGRDFLFGEGGDDRLYGNGGNDYLDGGGNKDHLYGGDGDDFLDGANGNDQLYANAGNDTLRGGKGSDRLDGGDGTDLVEQREAGDVLINIEAP